MKASPQTLAAVRSADLSTRDKLRAIASDCEDAETKDVMEGAASIIERMGAIVAHAMAHAMAQNANLECE